MKFNTKTDKNKKRVATSQSKLIVTTQNTNPKGIDKYNYISFFRKIQDFFGGKQMSNVEIVTNIDIASEIAHATVTEVLANMENERIGYVLIGVLQQLETIQDNVNNFDLKEQDKTTKEVA